MNRRFLLLAAWLFVWLLWPAQSAAIAGEAAAEAAFLPGERHVYQLRWGPIVAGQATLEVLPMEQLGGQESYHFLMTATSTEFIDVFYKVRDRIDAWVDAGMNHSLLYKKKQKEGSTERDIVVEFDWQTDLAHYSNYGKDQRQTPLLAGAFDPLSIFYYVRTLDINEQTEIARPVADGKKVVIGRGRILGRERLEVPAGTFDTFVLEPELQHIGGVFEKSKNAKLRLWITTDHRHMLVKMASKVIVGSFVAELTEAGAGASETLVVERGGEP